MLDFLFDTEVNRKRWKINEEQYCIDMFDNLEQKGHIIDLISDYEKIGIYEKNRFSDRLISVIKQNGKIPMLFDRAGEKVMCNGVIGKSPDTLLTTETDLLIISPVDYYETVRKSLPNTQNTKVISARELFYSA